jgi:hypothetical protein
MDRTKGFGSGDASNIAALGRYKTANPALLRRIAELKGLVEEVNISTPEIELGIEMERKIAEMLKGAVNNPLYESKKLSNEKYKIRNHIDFEWVGGEKIIWVEHKTSIRNEQELLAAYNAQLAWHYMLMQEKAEDAGIDDYELWLTSINPDGESELKTLKIQPNTLTFTLNEIKEGLRILPDVWDSVTEWVDDVVITDDNVPDVIREQVHTVREALLYIDDLNRKVDDFKAKMLKSMREAGVKSIKCDGLTITYVEKKETSRVDTKKLKAEMPESAKKYMTSSIADDYILLKFK